MQKLIELKKDESILVSSIPEKYLKPDYVYIPIKKEDKLLVNPLEKVKIGSDVSTTSISPISGIVKSLKKMSSFDDALYYLEIENDFEEQRIKEGTKKRKFLPEEALKVLSSELKNKKNLVLNAIDDELYVVTENFYLFLYYDVFLELLDDLDNMFHLEHIIVCVKSNSSESDVLKSQYMEFLKEKAYDVFSSVLNEMYQKIKCEGIPEPKLNIRNMKTRWGTCNIKTSVITLNLQLIKTDIDCIRQVASHELVHFKVKNHGKDFYRLLEKYVPNWKELKKAMDTRYKDGI